MTRIIRQCVALLIGALLTSLFIITPSQDARAVSTSMVLKFHVAAGDTITLPLLNPANVSVSWGDSTSDTSLEHTYASSGWVIVYISPDDISLPMTAEGFGKGNETWGYNGDLGGADKLIEVMDWGDFGLGFVSLSGAFQFANQLNSVPADIPSSVTDLSHLFENSAISQVNGLSTWTTSNVTRMEKLARNCPNFNTDLTDWDTGRVVNMDDMFLYANSFNNGDSPGDSHNPMSWDVRSVTTMQNMFDSALSFNQDISQWNTHHVHYMNNMFANAESFNQDLSDWDTSGVFEFTGMFSGATQFNNGDLPGESSTPLSWQININSTNPVVMDFMFSRTQAFNQDLSDWDVSHVSSMVGMFGGATMFNQDLSSWEVGAVLDMSGMFDNAQAFNQDLSDWDVSSLQKTGFMFHNAIAFNNGDGGNNQQHPLGWVTTSLFNAEMMFSGAESFNQSIPNWDTSATNGSGETLIGGMFHDANLFNQDVSGWDLSHVNSFGYEDEDYTYGMFEGARAFNQDISSWDVSNVTNFTGMFAYAETFNQDISNWEMRSATDVPGMFALASSFNQDLSGWDVSNVEDMSWMFYYSTTFNNGDTGDNQLHPLSWATTSLVDLSRSFEGAEEFNQDVSSWDLSNVTSLLEMFAGASAFDQDLSQWDVSSVEDASLMLVDSGMSINHYTETLIGWSQQSLHPGTPFTINQYYRTSAEQEHAVFASLWQVNDLGPDVPPVPPTPPIPAPTPSPSVSPSSTQSSIPESSSPSHPSQIPEVTTEVPSALIQSAPEALASTPQSADVKTETRNPQTNFDVVTISIAAGATLLIGSASVAGIQHFRRRRLR